MRAAGEAATQKLIAKALAVNCRSGLVSMEGRLEQGGEKPIGERGGINMHQHNCCLLKKKKRKRQRKATP